MHFWMCFSLDFPLQEFFHLPKIQHVVYLKLFERSLYVGLVVPWITNGSIVLLTEDVISCVMSAESKMTQHTSKYHVVRRRFALSSGQMWVWRYLDTVREGSRQPCCYWITNFVWQRRALWWKVSQHWSIFSTFLSTNQALDLCLCLFMFYLIHHQLFQKWKLS